MEQAYVMQNYGIKPIFFEKDNASMVLLNKREYDKMAMGYHELEIIKMLKRAKENRAAGKTKYHDWDDVFKELKAKHGF